MKFSNLSLTLIICFVIYSCNSQQTSIKIDTNRLLTNIQILASDSLEGRGFASEGNRKAQQLIINQFKEVGATPYFDNKYLQNFEYTFTGRRRRQRTFPIANPKKDYSNVPDTTLVGGNVVAKIKGTSEKSIVITAHLDHLGIRNGKIYNGADDDASGTAALITIAEYFKNKQPKHTLIFAAVDGEESGMLGSKHLVKSFQKKENIVLNINMDMIAHNDKNELYACGTYHYPKLKSQLENLNTPIQLSLGHDEPKNKEKEDWTYSSDHISFHKEKIPFIYFGVEDHKDYHKHTDTYENINQEFYIEALKLIIQAIERYDNAL